MAGAYQSVGPSQDITYIVRFDSGKNGADLAARLTYALGYEQAVRHTSYKDPHSFKHPTSYYAHGYLTPPGCTSLDWDLLRVDPGHALDVLPEAVRLESAGSPTSVQRKSGDPLYRQFRLIVPGKKRGKMTRAEVRQRIGQVVKALGGQLRQVA